MNVTEKNLSPRHRDELLAALKARFGANKARHPGLVWAKVQARLEANPDKLWSIAETARTSGEPDVVGVRSGEFVFVDCAPESPAGRRSVCYDREGWLSRKEARPKTTAIDLATEMGIALLTEEEYLALQKSYVGLVLSDSHTGPSIPSHIPPVLDPASRGIGAR